ncbi:hypothetical protein [Actinoplanes octamycinicus]
MAAEIAPRTFHRYFASKRTWSRSRSGR